MATTIDEFRTPRPIRGYGVVATAFAQAVFAWSFGFYGLSAYTQFLGVEGRWSIGLMSAATTLYFVAGAISIRIVDRLAARIGRRRSAMLGVLLLGGGASLLPHVTHPVPFFALYLVMAFGWASTSGTAITHVIGTWFDARRGLAMSLALTGASVSGFTVIPLMVWAIGRWGAGAGIALTAAATGSLVLLALRLQVDQPTRRAGDADAGATPAIAGTATGATTGTANGPARLRPIGLARTTAIFALGWLAQVAFIAQQLPMLTPRVGAADAATAVAITTLSAMLGRLVLGVGLDRLNHRLLTVACLASQVLGMLLMALTDSAAGIFVGCALFGASVGNLITLPAVFVQREFDARDYGRTVSRIWSTGQFFYAFGPVGAGLLFEASGSSHAVLFGCAALQVSAALLCLGRRLSPARTLP